MNLDNNFFYKKLFKSDLNGREINIYKLENVQLIGQNLYYPNCLFLKNKNVINPIDEKIMSLKDIKIDKKIYDLKGNKIEKVCEIPVFYFIYNTDNYYHFVYDTLPYLISFKKLKKEIPKIKLLMSYPNEAMDNFYPFVIEFLNLLDIDINLDVILANDKVSYKEIFISSSYTHGVNSNLPPRNEIYQLYTELVNQVNNINDTKEYPKKIYISRRSWLHNDFTNIGTNYTSRRKLINEDELVNSLLKKGYVEIFTEKLTTIEKIKLFSNVEHVIGPIGGGMCNVLFSKPNTKVTTIVSPTFLDINARFTYSFSNVKIGYYDKTKHVSNNYFKKYMRIKSGDIVGEIIDVLDDKLIINYSKNFVPGWNNSVEYDTKILNKKDCLPLDNGLNSEWYLDVNNFIDSIYNIN